MTFAEIEHVIDGPLPPAAFRHRSWWSNNASNNVMTRAWLEAGYQSERVDMESRRLVFRRVGRPVGGPPQTGPTNRPRLSGAARFERLYGALRGRVLSGDDLTAPTGESWEADR